MKSHKTSVMIGLGLCFGLWKAFEYRQFQETSHTNSTFEMKRLQNLLKKIEDDHSFLETHNSDVQELSVKKFDPPESRLITGKSIEEGAHSLHALHYTFEPMTSIVLEGYSYNTTKIIIDVAAILDTDIYDFIEKLLKDFPGVLHLSAVSLVLNSGSPPPYIKGKLGFEWYSMGEKR